MCGPMHAHLKHGCRSVPQDSLGLRNLLPGDTILQAGPRGWKGGGGGGGWGGVGAR